MELQLAGRAEMILSVGVAAAAAGTENLVIDAQSGPVTVTELHDTARTRLHHFEAGAGRVIIDYEYDVDSVLAPVAVDPLDTIRYLRPSRYAESDSLYPTARAEFAGLEGHALVDAVAHWVGGKLAYVSGSSLPTDGAARTLMARRGVCRDYAHLTIALLRSMDVPARMVSVYAPGLWPMDFHAVTEALVDGVWWVVDATGLAPRQSLLRIATGRDAADTAFLTNHGADLELLSLEVTATEVGVLSASIGSTAGGAESSASHSPP